MTDHGAPAHPVDGSPSAHERDFADNALRITCADAVELVTEYLEDALARADLDRFSAHLELCEGCRVFLDQTRQTVRLTAELGGEDVELEPTNFGELTRRLGRRNN